MTDPRSPLPEPALPEALIDAVAFKVALDLVHTVECIDPPRAAPNTRRMTKAWLDFALAFRGESDRQELWTWEEVEPLIEALKQIDAEHWNTGYVAERMRNVARVALARFRTPAVCPTCGQEWGWQPEGWECTDPFHRRAPESEGTNE